MTNFRKVRVLISPRSGSRGFSIEMQRVLEKYWDVPGIDLTYQLSKNIDDGRAKTQRAIAEGVDTMLVIGGDGMVNTIGSLLVGTKVALGVIPAGSGNGFARHFNIPLEWDRAAKALAGADRCLIDVGTANGRPFFVTCSMAWDGTLVRQFNKSPVRGILPYFFAAAYEFFEYVPQPFRITVDDQPEVVYPDPLICTAANLTQFGGGAQVAPHACADDGFLEFVVASRKDTPRLVADLARLFDGTFDQLPQVQTARFRRMVVKRQRAAPIQMDGELVESPAKVVVEILPRALTVLVPRHARGTA